MRAKPPKPVRRSSSDKRANSASAHSPLWHALATILVVVALLVAVRPRGESVDLCPVISAGEIADRDVIATQDFQVMRSASALREARARARATAPLVLVHRESVEFERRAVLDALYDALGRNEPLGRWSFGLSEKDLRAFSGDTPRARRLRRLVDRVVAQLFEQGIVSADIDSVDRPIVVRRAGGEETSGSDVLRSSALVYEVGRRVAALTDDPEEQRLVRTLVSAIAEPNLVVDTEESERRAQEAEAQVTALIATVKAGERIVRAHEVVTPLQAQKLVAYREVQLRSHRGATLWDRVREILATTGVFTLLVGGAIGGYLWRYRPDLAADGKKQVLLGVLLLSSALPSALITGSVRFEDVLSPVILAPLLATILLDAQVAIILAVVTVYSIALYSKGPALFALVGLMVSLATIYAVNNIRRRASYFGSIIIVAAIGIVTVLLVDQAYGVAFHRSFERLLTMTVSVVISFLVALFLLPALERLFGLTTDLTLSEYADLNHPLLRQLAVRAPGSFHHSIQVASLSEAAAAAIGANALMTRVGAYFHDVGKMAKPEYFIENQMGNGNKHDQLSPSMSALVIQNHVKVGIEMAREHKLPQVIIDFIPEHHGTSVISFFYNKAMTSEKHGEVRMDDYRYPGPKPSRRETAIVMIADTVEAASRSLDDPTPLRLEQMVQRTIREKFANGQLDQSNLTLDDLRRIGQAFLPILIGAFHVRIKYPETDEETIREMDKAQSKKARNGRDEEPTTRSGRAPSGGGNAAGPSGAAGATEERP